MCVADLIFHPWYDKVIIFMFSQESVELGGSREKCVWSTWLVPWYRPITPVCWNYSHAPVCWWLDTNPVLDLGLAVIIQYGTVSVNHWYLGMGNLEALSQGHALHSDAELYVHRGPMTQCRKVMLFLESEGSVQRQDCHRHQDSWFWANAEASQQKPNLGESRATVLLGPNSSLGNCEWEDVASTA